MSATKEDLISLAASLNRQVTTHSLAVWYLLAVKGIFTNEDQDLLNQCYAQAVHDIDQSQEESIREVMDDPTTSDVTRDLIRRSLGV